ncbi:MAG: hemin uptake protein HemP [Gemmataceae bacterium]
MSDHDNTNDPTPEVKTKTTAAPLVVDARALFQGGREIWIEHDGVRYRLRITRRNKLILQK